MDSFNTVCFASGQSIAQGDSCLVFPIVKSSSYNKVAIRHQEKVLQLFGATNSTCYSNAFWTPIGFTFECKFRANGAAAPVDTRENRLNLLHFFANLISHGADVESGETSNDDAPFKLKAFINVEAPTLRRLWEPQSGSPPSPEDLWADLTHTWAYIWQAFSQHRLFRAGHRGVFPLEFAIVHTESYKKLCERVEKSKDWEGKSLAYKHVFNRALKQLETSSAADSLASSMYARLSDFRDIFCRIGNLTGMLYLSETNQLNENLKSFLNNKIDKNLLFSRLKPLLEFRYFISGLEELNLKFSPIVSSPLDNINHTGKLYAKFVENISASVSAQRKRHYGEDDSD